MTTPRTIACFSVSAVLTTASMSSACPPTYELIGELEYDCGSQYTIFNASAINERRVVVGEAMCHISNSRVPFYWTPEEGLQLLPMTSTNLPAFAHDINEDDVICGDFLIPGFTDAYAPYTYRIGDDHPTILWSPTEDGWPFQGGYALAINDDGIIAGVAPDPQGERRACVWTTVMEPTFLPGTQGALSSIARDINNSNQVVYSVTQDGAVTGWVTSLGESRSEQVGPGDWTHISIRELDPAGRVVAQAGMTPSTLTTAVTWDGGMIDTLATPPKTEASYVGGVTDAGTIFGQINGDFAENDNWRGVVWNENEVAVIQHVLGEDVSIAGPMAMNARGDFVASSTIGYLVIGRVEFPVTDLNCDQTTSFEDLLLVLASWGGCSGACAADFDGNGFVDSIDLTLLLGAWSP